MENLKPTDFTQFQNETICINIQIENTVHHFLNHLWTDKAQTECQHTKLPHVDDRDST